MKNAKILTSCLSLFVALALSAWDWDDYAKFEERLEADLTGIDEVVIENVNGYIKVTYAADDRITIEATEKVKENDKVDPKVLADAINMKSTVEGSTLTVALDYGKFKKSKEKKYYSSDFDVMLPRRLSVRLETVNGSVVAPVFDGDVDLETVNGSIDSEGAGGKAVLETVNGKITIDAVGGSVNAETVNGNIEIENAPGPVDAETVNGEIKVSISGALKGDVSLETVNGSVTFKGGSNGFRIKAESYNGKIRNDLSDRFEGQISRRKNFMSGSVGSGNYTVSIDTMNGSIHIK